MLALIAVGVIALISPISAAGGAGGGGAGGAGGGGLLRERESQAKEQADLLTSNKELFQGKKLADQQWKASYEDERRTLAQEQENYRNHKKQGAAAEEEEEERRRRRKLLYDVDRDHVCFADNEDREHSQWGDFLEDPFLANGDRGDWGKCLPSEVFGILCEHMAAHAINNGEWQAGDGPLHDPPSVQLFPLLLALHNDYCTHLDVQIPPATQHHINDYLKYQNSFGTGDTDDGDASDDEGGTDLDAHFEVKAEGGKYFLNGHQSPPLTFMRGSKYVFDTTQVAGPHPLRIGTAVNQPYSAGVEISADGTRLTFRVPEDAPAALVYYCFFHPTMGSDLTVINRQVTEAPTPTPGSPSLPTVDSPTAGPTDRPTARPSRRPTGRPTDRPIAAPTDAPIASGETEFEVVYISRKEWLIIDGARNPTLDLTEGESYSFDLKGEASLLIGTECALYDDWSRNSKYKSKNKVVHEGKLYQALKTSKKKTPSAKSSKKFWKVVQGSCDVGFEVDYSQGAVSFTVPADSRHSELFYVSPEAKQTAQGKIVIEAARRRTSTDTSPNPKANPKRRSHSTTVRHLLNELTTTTTTTSSSSKSSTATAVQASSLYQFGRAAITYDMACVARYADKRFNLQMSVYCALAFFKEAVAPRADIFAPREYSLSASCTRMLKVNTDPGQRAYPMSHPPLEYCDSDPGADTCTVRAEMWQYRSRKSCRAYCEGFSLSCSAAHYADHDSSAGRCAVGREVACDTQLHEDEWQMVCTCGSYQSAASTPPNPATPLTRSAVAIMKESWQDGGASHFPLLCSQDYIKDTVRVLQGTNDEYSCNMLCGDAGLECLDAGYAWDGCAQNEPSTCRAKEWGLACTCGPPPGALAPLTSNLNTPTCERLAYSRGIGWSTREHLYGFCKADTIQAHAQDSCTALVKMYYADAGDNGFDEPQSCSTFCSKRQSMKCVAAAMPTWEDDSLGCDTPRQADKRSCDYVFEGWDHAMCQCAFDSALQEEEVEKTAEPLSNACINMALGSDLSNTQYYWQDNPYQVKKVCESSAVDNTCRALVRFHEMPAEDRSCRGFCSQFADMECTAAFETEEEHRHHFNRCDITNAVTESISCGRRVEDWEELMCQCGFQSDSPRAQSLFSGPALDAPNAAPTCPALEYNARGYSTNEEYRRYNKVTLTLEPDPAADGRLRVKEAASEQDFNSWTKDTLNSNVEVCDGLESTLRPGDDPMKCSYGERFSPGGNCYAKMELSYPQAQEACGERGGHLLKIDSEQEYLEIRSLFLHERMWDLSLGLHAGRDNQWEWDGSPGVPVDFLQDLSYLVYPDEQLDSSWAERQGCLYMYFPYNHEDDDDTKDDDEVAQQKREGRLASRNCHDIQNYICEANDSGDSARGGDLLADEGGFCLWYLEDPDLELPDDESNGFRNTELMHLLATQEDTQSRRYTYVDRYEDIFGYPLPGHSINQGGWEQVTLDKLGRSDSSAQWLDAAHESNEFHCHFSPTNFGMSRIYLTQHMLERIYPGAFKKHCFCGYKYAGHLVSRCDCTWNGNRNSNCKEVHRPLLWQATYRETGEYVYCNHGQCDSGKN